MKLRIINTGSAGNCYLFEAKDTTLIVECGVQFKQIKETLKFDFSKVCGAIITHEHLDHAKGIKDAIKAGIDIYASEGTIKAIGINNHRLHKIESRKTFNLGEFKIMPFDVKHDAAEPFGFLIYHPECGNTLFITDSYYVEYKFKNLHNVIIEANYDNEIINSKLQSGKLNGYVYNRVMKSHMSIETCIELLNANDLTQVNNIVLIHLSDSNSDAAMFKKQVIEATGKNTHIAEKGMVINLDKTPF